MRVFTIWTTGHEYASRDALQRSDLIALRTALPQAFLVAIDAAAADGWDSGLHGAEVVAVIAKGSLQKVVGQREEAIGNVVRASVVAVQSGDELGVGAFCLYRRQYMRVALDRGWVWNDVARCSCLWQA